MVSTLASTTYCHEHWWKGESKTVLKKESQNSTHTEIVVGQGCWRLCDAMKHLHVGPTCPCKEKHPMIMISMKHLGKHRWWTSDCDFATFVFVLSSFSRTKTNALGLNVFASPPKNHGLFWTFLVLCLWWPSNSPKDFLVYHERNKSRVSKKSNNASKCLHGCPPGVNFLSSTETSIRQSAGWTPWDLDALRKKLTARQFPVLNWTPAAQVCEGIPVLPAKPWDAVFFY